MRRDLDVYLWDVREAGQTILSLTAGKDFAQFSADSLLKLAIERCFTILGEAIVRIKIHFVEDWAKLVDGQKIIGFRNQLVHLYDQIDDSEVWRIITISLPLLMKQVDEMLEGLRR